MIALACGFVALALVGIAITFLAAPDWAMENFPHSLENLPYVMGGRYLFFAFILMVCVLRGDRVMLAATLFGFACVAFIDAWIYFGEQAEQHLTAGVLCLIGSFVVFRANKGAD